MKKQAGFTLLETLIYLALFAILIGGVLASVYSITENSGKIQAQTVLQQEANFILMKIDWAITGSTAIVSPAVGVTDNNLQLTKSSGSVFFQPSGGNKLQIKEGTGPFTDLNNDDVVITAISFQHVAGGSGKPESTVTTFTLSDNYGHNQVFSKTRFLRR